MIKIKPVRKDIRLEKDCFIVEKGSRIYYGLISPINIHFQKDTTIMGDIICKRKVKIDGNMTIQGDIFAYDSIEIYDDTIVMGNVVSGGNILMNGTVNVSGKILADGDISVRNIKAKLIECAGDIIISGKVNCRVIRAGGRIVTRV